MYRGKTNTKILSWAAIVTITAATAVGCAGGPMTTREKGAGIGAVGGAAAGGLIGSAFGRPGMGAAIGAGTGLGAGALVGDYMQGQEQAQYQYNQQQIQQNQRVIEQNRYETQRYQRTEY
jgi:phage tail tape-measure protein